MKLRLVRTTDMRTAPRYTVLFADGTMVNGLNLGHSETRLDKDGKAWRKISRRILYDVLTHFEEYKRLSAKNYEIDDAAYVGRWDSPDGCENMSLWGSDTYITELIVTDVGQLCVYNPVLTTFVSSEDDCNFAFEEHPEEDTKANSLKLRLVKTGTTLRDGLYLLWPNGVREQVCIDETNTEAANKIINILSNYIDVDKQMAPDAQSVDDACRWHKDGCASVSMDDWGANCSTVLAVTGNNVLCVKNPAALQILNLAASKKASISFDGARTVTMMEYCYLALLAGVFDEKLDATGIMMDRNLHQPLNPANNEAFEKKFKNYRIRVLKILKQSYDNELPADKGFLFAKDKTHFTKAKNGDIEWYLPVYYPGDPEYEQEFGQFNIKPEEAGRPCLPRYPMKIGSLSDYVPIRITESMQQRFEEYLTENNKIMPRNRSAEQ